MPTHRGFREKNPKEKTQFHACDDASLPFAWIRKKNPANENLKSKRESDLYRALKKNPKERTHLHTCNNASLQFGLDSKEKSSK